jgi:hypothetical protein
MNAYEIRELVERCLKAETIAGFCGTKAISGT